MKIVTATGIIGLGIVLAAWLRIASSAPVPPPSRPRPTGIFVSTEGSDTARGTFDAPLRSVAAAANRAKPGQTVYLRGGTYEERAVIDGSGTPTGTVTYRPYGKERVVFARGLEVAGSYNRVSRITITPGMEKCATGQLTIGGDHNVVEQVTQYATFDKGGNAAHLTGSYNVLKGIDFRDCGPVVTSLPGSHNTIEDGTVHHTGSLIAVLASDYSTLKDLDMHDSGRTSTGQSDPDGNSADGINLWGSHITISGNRIYNIFSQQPKQHADAIQWWKGADDLVIENNTIGSRATGGINGEGDLGHIMFETDYGETSQRVIIRNNVFLGDGAYYVINSAPSQTAPGSADDWQIVGNTFADGKQIRSDLLPNMRRMRIVDNVFLQPQDLRPGEGSVCDYNAYVGVPVGGNEGSHSFTVTDAGFVNDDLSSATSFGLRADMHLAGSSPLKGKGSAVAALALDKDGKKRPTTPSIGAYEAP